MKNLALLPILVITGQLLSSAHGQDQYCRISSAHTLCQFQGRSPSCSSPRAIGLTDAEKNHILTLHNKLRSVVALGEESRGTFGPQPPAADMQELVWDDELAVIAQRWAEQCNFGHDQSRDVPRFKVGQNVYETSRSRDQPLDQLIRIGVMGWYDEVKDFNGNEVSSYRFNSGTGHYTQMVWADTNKIGCGHITYNRGGLIKKYLVCNYGPSGNVIRTPMYTIGEACSKCRTGCSHNFPGLCSSSESSSNGFQPISPVEDNAISQGPVLENNNHGNHNNNHNNNPFPPNARPNPPPVFTPTASHNRPVFTPFAFNNNNNRPSVFTTNSFRPRRPAFSPSNNHFRPVFNTFNTNSIEEEHRPVEQRPPRRRFNFMHSIMNMFHRFG